MYVNGDDGVAYVLTTNVGSTAYPIAAIRARWNTVWHDSRGIRGSVRQKSEYVPFFSLCRAVLYSLSARPQAAHCMVLRSCRFVYAYALESRL